MTPEDNVRTVKTQLNILSGGAAHGLVRALEAAFTKATGQTIGGTFGAVGAMRAKLAAGAPADVVIFTSVIVRELAAQGIVVPHSVTDLGGVETGIAIRTGDSAPEVADAESLTLALIAADEIYCPDPQQATAGIHFASVLEKPGHCVGSKVAAAHIPERRDGDDGDGGINRRPPDRLHSGHRDHRDAGGEADPIAAARLWPDDGLYGGRCRRLDQPSWRPPTVSVAVRRFQRCRPQNVWVRLTRHTLLPPLRVAACTQVSRGKKTQPTHAVSLVTLSE